MSSYQETRYLYSKENSQLYRGFLEEHNSSECMYARNLVAIMDGHTKKMNSFYENHIVGCKTCQEVARSASWKNQRVRALIPKVDIPTHLPQLMKSDLKEALHLHKKSFGETTPSMSALSLFTQSMKELFQSRLILKSIFQGIVIAAFPYLLLWTVSV